MFDNRSPIYQQIADQIRTDVLHGTLQEGGQIMSTNQYAEMFRINPATAAKAFQELVTEGVIYKRRGVGMFVASGAREQLAEQRRARFFAEVVDPMITEAAALGIPVDQVIAHIRGDEGGER
ncbi:GntR family transcriptional regulator [Nocardia puris]|uniref:GntR family transcriptional regulator n=1 Tax=Nocardia puris TaxID=208602 RepID=UPI0008343F25|nr:GntR family transcriptional regulator [Nocardia puris]MBF6210614.1 GntR family transcriptional regulator [Nocardia puris]MBF6369340.1 GntR family transcriptional regulator [Nocardia puris]MBF6457875.1 GntR family transcriptional regulator [Nocardia puris]